DEAQLGSFLERFQNEGWPPIRGVIHAAGVVQLHTIVEMNIDSLKAVLRPKVLGSWLLHRLLRDTPLDFFVLFSSFSSLLCSPRLGHYAGANAFLDALAHHRHAQAAPALSVNWGAWAEVGVAARYFQAGHQPLSGATAFTPK